ncbi:MAG: NAD(+)/NADH kinase, partial [Leptospiraceae bacterium]|nr:NAD(+)/NADH kinase [Leptospiraceae bacterium]
MKQVLIVIKKTKYELDQEIYPDREFYSKITQIQNNSFERVYNSHLRQLESRRILQEEVFPEGKFIFREDLDRIHPKDYDLVIALGGDNHFTYVAHQIMGTPILGCNSDTLTSRGVLLGFNPQTLKETVENNWQGI